LAADLTVGLVIPVWNGERWLGEALESALAQRQRPIEVVVVDDGSTDQSAAIAEGFGPPVRVVRQANAGAGAARNRGVGLLATELIAFLDADDLLTPVSIACRAEVLARHPEIDIVFGQVCRFAERRDGVPVALNEPQPGHLPGMMLVRSSALAQVGAFATHTSVAEGLDWLLRARELGLGELALADQVAWRRVHGENNSLRNRAEIGEFAHALKASLDRRRAAHRPNPERRR